MFNLPDPETEIGPLESLIHHETRPMLYKNVKNYGRINYKCYQREEIGLESWNSKDVIFPSLYNYLSSSWIVIIIIVSEFC